AFGCSIALSGDTVAVGADFENGDAVGVNGVQRSSTDFQMSGAAYVFRRAGPLWPQLGDVKASNTRATAFFGLSVALSGNVLVVGSPNESSNATGVNGDQTNTSAPVAGAVYVY